MDAALLVGAKGAAVPVAITGLNEYVDVTDVTLNLTKGEADVTTRGNNGWKSICSTLKEASIDITAFYKGGNTQYDLLRDAYLDNDIISAAVVTSAEAPYEGLVGWFVVQDFTLGQAMEEGQQITIRLSLNTFGAWVDVGA
jgi:hypothetical protein